MTAALRPNSAKRSSSRSAIPLQLVVRPAPPREPPFDDEVPAEQRGILTGYEQRLPFECRQTPLPRPRALRPAGVPDPEGWARRLLIGLIESADGRRPLAQLSSMLSKSVAIGLGADFERAAINGRPHWLHRSTVRTVRACLPAEGVAELCATLENGRRVRAVAMRLETQHGRWRCTRLQLG